MTLTACNLKLEVLERNSLWELDVKIYITNWIHSTLVPNRVVVCISVLVEHVSDATLRSLKTVCCYQLVGESQLVTLFVDNLKCTYCNHRITVP